MIGSCNCPTATTGIYAPITFEEIVIVMIKFYSGLLKVFIRPKGCFKFSLYL